MESEPLKLYQDPQSVISASECPDAEEHNGSLKSEPALVVGERWSANTRGSFKITLPLFLQLKDTYCESQWYYAVSPWMASSLLSEPWFHPRVGEPRHASMETAALGSGLTADMSVSCMPSLKDTVGPRPGFSFHHLLGRGVGRNSVVRLH